MWILISDSYSVVEMYINVLMHCHLSVIAGWLNDAFTFEWCIYAWFIGRSGRLERVMDNEMHFGLQKVRFVVEEAVRDRFSVDSTGELKLKTALDYEAQTSYKFIVWVTDGVSVIQPSLFLFEYCVKMLGNCCLDFEIPWDMLRFSVVFYHLSRFILR